MCIRDRVNTPYTLKLELDGASISVYLNGELKFTASDSSFTNGAIGVRTYKQSVSISDVEVKSLTPDEKTASDVASEITELTAPAKGDKALTLPSVPEGFSVAVTSSSNESAIALDGAITPPMNDTDVTLVLTVSKGTDTAETVPLRCV